MAGNFDDTRENRRGPEESDEFDLDAELAGLSSFLQEMGVQLEDENTGDEVTGDVTFDFSDEEAVSRVAATQTAEEEDSQEEEDLSWIFGADGDLFEDGESEDWEGLTDPENGESEDREGLTDTENGENDGWEGLTDSENGENDGWEGLTDSENGENDGWEGLTDTENGEEEADDFAETDDRIFPEFSENGMNMPDESDVTEKSEPAYDFILPKEPDAEEETAFPEGMIFPDAENAPVFNEDDRSEAEEREKRRRAEKEVDRVLRKTFGKPFSWKREVLSWVAMFVIAFALAFVIDNYLIVNATVPTGSMQNTIMAGDRMIGWRLSYLFSDPERGDIIIFEYPDNPEEIYVKRVIGLPGETVTITNGEIYINDSTEPLEEDYLPEEWVWKNDGYTFVVPENSYLCLGDNRNNSHDARSWTNTYVTKDAILGQAVLCYWPADDFGWLN